MNDEKGVLPTVLRPDEVECFPFGLTPPLRLSRPESSVTSGLGNTSEYLLCAPVEALTPAERVNLVDTWTDAGQTAKRNLQNEIEWRQKMREANAPKGSDVSEYLDEAGRSSDMLGGAIMWAVCFFLFCTLIYSIGFFRGWWR